MVETSTGIVMFAVIGYTSAYGTLQRNTLYTVCRPASQPGDAGRVHDKKVGDLPSGVLSEC